MTHTDLRSLFSDIADAIRAKTGDTAEIVADNFADAIAEIETGEGQDILIGTMNFVEETTKYIVTHNKGTIPKYIIVYPSQSFAHSETTVALTSIASIASPTQFFSVFQGTSATADRLSAISGTFDWTNRSAGDYGVIIHDVSQNSFELFPSTTYKSRAWEYRWIAIF